MKNVKLLGAVRIKAFDEHSLFCKLLKNLAVGRLVFKARILLFKIDSALGNFNQRHIEYPWILRKLRNGKGKLLLDVGCSGSLLDHELVGRGFRVVGLDLNDHAMRCNSAFFVKRNVLATGLPSETFDVVVVASVIEHVGLNVYCQNVLDSNADFDAVQEITRLLKPNGFLVLTLPYEGKGPSWIFCNSDVVERRYDKVRLRKLLENFAVVEESFYLCQTCLKNRFTPVAKSVLDELPSSFSEGSLGCLLLQKL